jgi:hypothetical protein
MAGFQASCLEDRSEESTLHGRLRQSSIMWSRELLQTSSVEFLSKHEGHLIKVVGCKDLALGLADLNRSPHRQTYGLLSYLLREP